MGALATCKNFLGIGLPAIPRGRCDPSLSFDPVNTNRLADVGSQRQVRPRTCTPRTCTAEARRVPTWTEERKSGAFCHARSMLVFPLRDRYSPSGSPLRPRFAAIRPSGTERGCFFLPFPRLSPIPVEDVRSSCPSLSNPGTVSFRPTFSLGRSIRIPFLFSTGSLGCDRQVLRRRRWVPHVLHWHADVAQQPRSRRRSCDTRSIERRRSRRIGRGRRLVRRTDEGEGSAAQPNARNTRVWNTKWARP